jgi:hypothetical protein
MCGERLKVALPNELNYKELYSHEHSMCISIDWLRTHVPAQIDSSFDYNVEDNAIKDRLI